jgi:beta-lactamase class A
MVLVKKGMRTTLATGTAAIALAATTIAVIGTAQADKTTAQASRTVTPAVSAPPLCTAPRAYATLAAKLSKDISAAVAGRSGHIAIRVEDVRTGVECRYNEGTRSHSASVIKATILAALLYWRQQTHTSLSTAEQDDAYTMITQSDNCAASQLWNDVGPTRMQQFVNAATMTETQLSPGGTWGLSNITARDELQLMRILTEPNSVLSNTSRGYELTLMKEVISSERWGVPTGAPSGLSVYNKNGWLNDPVLWVINTIGAIQGGGRDYKMAILTYNNSGEQYGINTVNAIASVANRDLNIGLPAAGAPLRTAMLPRAAQGQPDEALPAEQGRSRSVAPSLLVC